MCSAAETGDNADGSSVAAEPVQHSDDDAVSWQHGHAAAHVSSPAEVWQQETQEEEEGKVQFRLGI